MCLGLLVCLTFLNKKKKSSKVTDSTMSISLGLWKVPIGLHTWQLSDTWPLIHPLLFILILKVCIWINWDTLKT